MSFYARGEIGAAGCGLASAVLEIRAHSPSLPSALTSSLDSCSNHRPKKGRVALVAVYAARDLVPGEELFVHYGDDIGRGYAVGDPAPAVFKYEITAEELPYNWLPPCSNALRDGYRSD